MTVLENVRLFYILTQGAQSFNHYGPTFVGKLLRVAIGAEIKVSSFLSLLNFNVLFLNEPP